MKAFGKIALLAAGAASLAVSVPAQARNGNWGGRGDGIDAGDVIAGALIIGGIAAVASAVSDNDYGYRGGSRDRYRDRDYNRGYGYNDGGNGYYNNGYSSRQAVDQCVRAAKRAAGSGWARVTDVTSINRIRGGYEIRGRLVVEDRGNGRGNWGRSDWRGNDDRYGNRYDRYNDGYDKGRFNCVTRYGNVEDVNLSGLRGQSRYY